MHNHVPLNMCYILAKASDTDDIHQIQEIPPTHNPSHYLMNSRSETDLFDISRVSCRASLSSKKKCLQMLAELMEGSIDEHQLDESVDMEVIDALAARERLGCTGLGHGVAIPHGRVDFVSKPIAAAITLSEPINFDAADGIPVDIVVGLLIPEAEIDGHLRILASLAKFFNSAENRDAMRQTHSAEEILEFLQNIEQPDDQSDSNGEPDAASANTDAASKRKDNN